MKKNLFFTVVVLLSVVFLSACSGEESVMMASLPETAGAGAAAGGQHAAGILWRRSRPQGTECRCVKLSCKFRPNAKKLFPNRHQTVKNAVRSLQTSGLCAIMEITSAHGP